MKKLIPIIAALFILALGTAALAKEQILRDVTVLDTSLSPTVNYIKNVEEGLPCLYYCGITYLPLDDYHTTLLGISVTETDSDIIIEKLTDDGEYRLVPEPTEETPGGPIYAVEKNVIINGCDFGRVIVRSEGYYPAPSGFGYLPFPFARFGGTLYMPATFLYAQELGWKVYGAGDSLSIYADSRFYTTYEKGEWGNGWYTETNYYLVRGLSSARVKSSRSRFSSDINLCYSYNGSEFIEFKNKFFPEFYEKGMEIEGDTLCFDGCYFGGVPRFTAHIGSTPAEVYRLRLDMNTGELMDTELIKRNVYNTLYEIFEDEAGNVDLYIDSSGDDKDFYYDGGHVFLNGTMMRSYTCFLHKAQGRDEDGRITASEGGLSPYWIRVEDLENYGYDMVTDFENRATYFTRNPTKPITPLGFEGTDENIPVYESDWRIYIDGVEPKRYFNIGGYTMVNSGELGKYGEGELDPGYHVRYVTTADMKLREYENETIYDASKPLDSLEYKSYENVIYSSVSPNKDGRLVINSPEKLRAATEKIHSDRARIYLAVECDAETASDEKLRHNFIESAVWLTREYGLDGIYLNLFSDWEYSCKDLAEELRSDPRITIMDQVI